MPKVPPEDGIERHKAYTRLNPMGHKEFVPDDDEETLNELSDDIMGMIESVAFGGPLPTGGGAGSPEQLQTDRRHNRLVSSSGDQVREAGEDVNNFTSTTPQAADGPERSRAKSKIKTSTIRGNGPRNKYIAGYGGDGLDYGASHNESFTGTGAIAISPGGGYRYVDLDDDEEEDQDPDKQTESNMSRQNDVLTEQVNQLLAEWEPSFKGGEYSPGDYQMPSPTGDGVAERKPKKDKVGKYDTNTSNQGKEWPRDHNETAAMCDVDDDGVEHKPQGSHESSVGEPKDGHQSEMGHNWPDEAKNSGSGVAEPFEGNRWSDGGTLQGGSGQDEMDNAGRAQKMPSDGPITGTSGPQLGQPSESRWSPSNMAALMEGDVNLQDLFDSYARDYEMVCVEDFQALCNAHGAGASVDEISMLQLMESNREFIFYQGEDANGLYWTPTPIAENLGAATAGIAAGAAADAMDDDEEEDDIAMEGKKPFPGAAPPFGSDDEDGGDDDDDDDCAMESKKPWEDDEEDDDEDCMAEGENRRPFGKTISELQVRSPGAETGRFRPEREENPEFGAFADANPGVTDMYDAGDPDLDPAYDERLGAAHGAEAQFGPGPYTGAGCPECGAPETGEAACPECGADMGMGPEEDQFGPGGDISRIGTPEDVDDPYYDRDYMETKIENGPAVMESLHNFMQSARRILEQNQEFAPQHIGEALRYSWAYHARSVNPQTTPTKVKATLEGLAKRFPAFAMVMEGGGDAMESADGSAIGTGGASNHSDHLPKSDTEMDDHGEPLGASQENDLEGTPEMKGTAKGMDGKGSVAQAVKENVARLSRHVQKAIQEGARSLRGKFDVEFSLLVAEGDNKNRTPIRKRLAEALADAEELLQLHKADDVELEASFKDTKGAVVLKHNVPLLTIKPRGLLTSEGKALFRFQRNAERFANELVAEGYTCRVIGHNWGRAVTAKTPIAIAEGAFKTLAEKKWIQGAVNPEHEGYCTPMSKSTCTPRRKALAKRFKKGGDLHSGKED